MQKLRHCRTNAGRDGRLGLRALLASGVMALLASCTQPTQAPPQPAAAAPPPAPPVQPVPFPQAVLNAANGVFSTAPTGGQQRLVVIDPLVNGVTGEQTAATQQIQDQIIALARDKYPQFDIQPFTAAAVAQGPNVMVGTFTPVNAQGQTAGMREGYRFCLVMVDLKAGKTVAKSVARARLDGVDATPTGFFRDSPSWTNDASIKSYIDTCQATKVGDPVSPTFLNGILTAAIISDAIEAYDASRYREALDLYTAAQTTPAGNQLRVYNGLYLTNWKLNRHEQAEEAFGRVVDYGLDNNVLAVKILFRPGSTTFDTSQQTTGPYDMWLRQIATHSASRQACLQVMGNTSPSGSAALNDQLSQLRAEYVERRLEEDAPSLQGHLIATGVGSKNNLVGTGADDLTDALDRRVDFKVIPSC
jgi:outer membrane protein OmpA-like peptidoglycan-associated protein